NITIKNKEYQTTLEAKLILRGTELIKEDLDTHADLLTTIIKGDELLQIRREITPNKQEDLIEWSELNKLIRKNVGEDIRKYNTRVIRETIENHRK
ncbi:hypothetical protein HHI36_006463, partial [Cryptolaemus montrouzieri]